MTFSKDAGFDFAQPDELVLVSHRAESKWILIIQFLNSTTLKYYI